METSETDPFGELPGYRGSMTLVDRANARLVGIGFYATAGQADEADALLATMPEALAAAMAGGATIVLGCGSDSNPEAQRAEPSASAKAAESLPKQVNIVLAS